MRQHEITERFVLYWHAGLVGSGSGWRITNLEVGFPLTCLVSGIVQSIHKSRQIKPDQSVCHKLVTRKRTLNVLRIRQTVRRSSTLAAPLY